MKKSRITALLTVCAMVGIMVFGIVPGVYAEEAEPIRIEGESISGTGISSLTNETLSEGKALLFQGDAGKNNTVSYTVNVTKAGLYTMNVKSSRQGARYVGDDGLQWPSPYWVQVNDEAPFTFSEGSAYDKYGYGNGMIITDTAATPPGSYGSVDPLVYTLYEIPVYLHEGDNTVNFIVKDKHISNTKVYFYLDYFELTYQSSGAANLPVLVEGEEYADTNVPEAGVSTMTDDALNGGAALKISTAEAIPADGFYADYTATVAKEGMYTLEFASSIQGYETADEGSNENCKAVSPYTVKVNDGNVLAFRDFSGYRRSEKTVGDMKLVTYAVEVHLNRGVNTVRFAVNKGRLNDNTVMFALDYLKLSPLMHYFAEDFKVEGESFSKASVAYNSDNCVRNNDGLSNNKGAYFNTSAGVPSLDYEFYVEKEGDYAVYTASAKFGQTWTSDNIITVNGGTPITVDATTSEQVSDITTTKDPNVYTINAVKSTLVHLNKGYNTMNVTAAPKTSGGNSYMLGLDYVRFVKAGTSVSQNANYANYKNNGKHTMNDFRFNGRGNGIYVPELKTEAVITGTAALEHSFFVSEDGDYTLTADFGGNITDQTGDNVWASRGGVKFDNDTDFITLTTTNCEFKALGSLNQNTFGSLTYNSPISLSKGWHTLHFQALDTATAEKAPAGKTTIYWQGFTLEKAADVDTAALSFADPVITVGESTQAKITYLSAAGDEVTGDPVSYTSSNTNVATVDSNGGIMAFNPGKTNIIACAGVDAVCEAELIVLPEGSTVFAQEVRRDNTKKEINVRVSSIGDMQADEEVSVIVASYATEEGLPTTLKSVSVNKVSGLKNGINQDIPVQIEDLQASDTVNLYIWRSMGELVPLWTKDEVIVNN